ncbi:MAG TPA: APC family permease [Dehalococcoidia bacterium]|nr:APC family permease [Dehalococcoidia bacterium]
MPEDRQPPPADGHDQEHHPEETRGQAQRPRVMPPSAPRSPRTPIELRGAVETGPTTQPQPRAAGVAVEQRAEPMRPGLEIAEVRGGSRPGSQYVRIMRAQSRSFTPVAPGILQATGEATRPRSGLSRTLAAVRRRLIGSPLATAQLAHERLTKVKALAVFSSDALSSVAYATEEILVVLVAASGAFGYIMPISVGIVILLAIVAMSYRQTIHAYPNGGGSYIVAHSELGVWPGLVAAASLMVDYVLTVAVSISSGVQAVTSAIEALHPYTVEIALAALLFMVVVNLRGVKESGTIFAAPTYVFIASIILMIIVAFVKIAAGGASPLSEGSLQQGAHVLRSTGASIGIFLILRAFASGCTAMTGVEAISNGVPAFKPPESDNARTTLTWMAVTLGIMFMGISILAHHYGILPDDPAQKGAQTVLSKIAHEAFGQGNNPLYIITQAATFLILVLAANTSFADFPRLSSILAHDGYMPHQFAFRGDRLAFSNGIIVLGLISAGLIVLFKANTDALIPLYAVGVFVSFTLSQSGMVHHWYVRRAHNTPGENPHRSMIINGTGAIATGVVSVVIAGTKFIHGAWIVLLLIPLLVLALRAIGRHYESVEKELEIDDFVLDAMPPPATISQTVIVPVGALNRAVLDTLSYAMTIAKNVTAVHVTDNVEDAEHLRQRWEAWAPRIPLVILESPYRSLTEPLLAFIDMISQQHGPSHTITVVLPEFVPKHWYQHLLHGQTALRLKAALLFRPNTVVIDVPRHQGRASFRERTARPLS